MDKQENTKTRPLNTKQCYKCGRAIHSPPWCTDGLCGDCEPYSILPTLFGCKAVMEEIG